MNVTRVSPLPAPFGDAQRQLLLEAKRLYLQQFVASGLLWAPAELWNCIVANRFTPSGDQEQQEVAAAEEVEEQGHDSLRLNYEGFRAVVEELLLRRVREFRAQHQSARGPLTAEEAQQLYFAHPLLSPRTFLAFPRDLDGCIAAVPLFTYVAKKLLLYNLRAKLEMCATVIPAALRPRPELRSEDEEGAAASASSQASSSPLLSPRVGLVPVCRSSPLSNALTSDDIEAFIALLLPNLRLVRDMPSWMLPYYLCHASQKFAFMLDGIGVGAVSIEALMRCDAFSELLRLYEGDEQEATVQFRVGTVVEVDAAHVAAAGGAGEAAGGGGVDEAFVEAVVTAVDTAGHGQATYHLTVTGKLPPAAAALPNAARALPSADGSTIKLTLPRELLHWCPATTPSLPEEFAALDNWFALPIMHRVYKTYCDLDTDQDGLLTVSEMRAYNGGSFTPLVIERVFELFVRGGIEGRMDYKTFLHFVIATEHPSAEPSLRYLWKIVDLHGTGSHVAIDVLRVFSKAVAGALLENGLMIISADSILAEVIDMINPAWHEHITLEDIRRCGHGGTVLPIILDHRNFYAYDCREQVAAGDSSTPEAGETLPPDATDMATLEAE